MNQSQLTKFNLFLKRTFDILISFLAIVILLVIPVLLFSFILVKISSKGPTVFKQKRVGKDKKIFTMYKFRTMILETHDKNGNEIMSEDRITKIGKFLRRTSLDELPQLFNILKGDMSLVGPRPMLDYQAERCTEEENLRFLFRPGITGWAQVKGRNNIRWEERIQYDLEYIRNFSVFKDIQVLFMTFLLVVKGTGTDVKPVYRGVDRFSKSYVPNTEEDANS